MMVDAQHNMKVSLMELENSPFEVKTDKFNINRCCFKTSKNLILTLNLMSYCFQKGKKIGKRPMELAYKAVPILNSPV